MYQNSQNSHYQSHFRPDEERQQRWSSRVNRASTDITNKAVKQDAGHYLPAFKKFSSFKKTHWRLGWDRLSE